MKRKMPANIMIASYITAPFVAKRAAVWAKMSDKQKEYRKFFKEKLKEHDVKSPAELDEKGKKKFFNEIEKEWTKDKD